MRPDFRGLLHPRVAAATAGRTAHGGVGDEKLAAFALTERHRSILDPDSWIKMDVTLTVFPPTRRPFWRF